MNNSVIDVAFIATTNDADCTNYKATMSHFAILFIYVDLILLSLAKLLLYF